MPENPEPAGETVASRASFFNLELRFKNPPEHPGFFRQILAFFGFDLLAYLPKDKKTEDDEAQENHPVNPDVKYFENRPAQKISQKTAGTGVP